MNCSREKNGNIYDKKLPDSGPYTAQVDTICQGDNAFTKSHTEFISSQAPQNLDAVKKSLEDVSLLGWGANIIKTMFGTNNSNHSNDYDSLKVDRFQQQHKVETEPVHIVDEIPKVNQTLDVQGGGPQVKRNRHPSVVNNRKKSSKKKQVKTRKHASIKASRKASIKSVKKRTKSVRRK